MSQSGQSMIARSRADWAVPAGLLVAAFLLLLGGNLAGNGAFAQAVATGPAVLHGWEQGSLLRVLVVWVASGLGLFDADTALLLLHVLMASLCAILFYRFLRVSDWPSMQALVAVALVASNGVLLNGVTTASPDFPILLAVAALIPAQRRLESVGDVQSIINYGLTLPLLLLAGPPLAALIAVLVLAVPFSEAEAREKPQVFAAMWLVAVVPTLIVITGVWAMAGRAGIGMDVLAQPFADRFALVSGSVSPLLPALFMLVAMAPVALVLVAHAIVPDPRRKLLTTLIALALPLYLAVGNSVFAWQLAPWTPAAAMMATTVGWLGTTRVRPWMRWMVLAMLLASSLGSWLLAPMWAEPAWLGGLWPIRLFGLPIETPGLG